MPTNQMLKALFDMIILKKCFYFYIPAVYLLFITWNVELL